MSSNDFCDGSASWSSPGAGITKSYDCSSESLRIFIVFFCGLAIYNACEMIVMIFYTFRRYKGSYFFSMLIAGAGIIPYSIGFLLKFLVITSGSLSWFPLVLLTIGWWAMVTGQSFVLQSRLHLIVTGHRGDRLSILSRRIIITNIFLMHVPTSILTFASNGSVDTNEFRLAYNVMEKIQMSVFCVQEMLLSSIFVYEAIKMLRTSLQPATRKFMRQLLVINLAIILMDLGLVALEYASLYILETLLKGTVYSIKLKLEFLILGKLIRFVEPEGNNRTGSIEFLTARKMSDDNNSVKLDRISTNVTHPSALHTPSSDPHRRKASTIDRDIARFEHIENASLKGSFSTTPSLFTGDEDLQPLHVQSGHAARGGHSFGGAG